MAGYNAQISENVSKLLSDGLPVMLLDIFSALNTTSDLDQDGIHPNDRGHALIGRTFLQNIDKSLGTLAKPSLP